MDKLRISNPKQFASMLGTTVAALGFMGVVNAHTAHADDYHHVEHIADTTNKAAMTQADVDAAAAHTEARANLYAAVTNARNNGLTMNQQQTNSVITYDSDGYADALNHATASEQAQADAINTAINNHMTGSMDFVYTDVYLQPDTPKPNVTINNSDGNVTVHQTPTNVSGGNWVYSNQNPASTVNNNITTTAPNVNVTNNPGKDVTNNVTTPTGQVTNNITVPSPNVTNNYTNGNNGTITNVTNHQDDVNVNTNPAQVTVDNGAQQIYVDTKKPNVVFTNQKISGSMTMVNAPQKTYDVSTKPQVINITLPPVKIPDAKVTVPVTQPTATAASNPVNNMLEANVNLVKAAKKHKAKVTAKKHKKVVKKHVVKKHAKKHAKKRAKKRVRKIAKKHVVKKHIKRHVKRHVVKKHKVAHHKHRK